MIISISLFRLNYMNLSSSKYIRVFVAVFFLAIYANVLVKNITCNLGSLFVQEVAISSEVDHHEHSHNNSHTHSNKHHSHEHGNNHNEVSKEKPDSEHSSKEKCCNSETAKIFSSLSTPSQFDYSLKTIEFHALNVYACSFSSNLNRYKLVVTNYSLPPPKIPDIRVAIQSLII